MLVLRPVSSAAREYPCRADAAIVIRCAEDDDAPIGGQRDRGCRLPNSAGANQPLVLSPLTAATGKHHCHASIFANPPTMAMLPSADSAMDVPRRPTAPVL